MCESDNSSQPVTLLQSTARLAAAVTLGLFNSLVLFLFITPPLAVWLIWKYPYIAIPSVVTYYFLRCASFVLALQDKMSTTS